MREQMREQLREFNTDDLVIAVRPVKGVGIYKRFFDLELYLTAIYEDGHNMVNATLMGVPEGYDEATLWEIAERNTMKKLNRQKMANFLGIGDGVVEIITNEMMYKGAGVIMFYDLYRSFCERNKIKWCYVVPSSIHEILLVPAENISADEINGIIKNINRTVLTTDDFLADHAYIYDATENEVRIC